jgi:hypothetical protein
MFRMARAAAVLAATAAALTVGATAATAQPAASNSYSDTGICGAGYWRIDHHDLPHATIYLDYNGSTDCAVTIKNANVGTPTYTEAFVYRQTDAQGGDDAGNFSYYAGPERTYAPNTCVFWGGGDDTGAYWPSGWTHCG